MGRRRRKTRNAAVKVQNTEIGPFVPRASGMEAPVPNHGENDVVVVDKERVHASLPIQPENEEVITTEVVDVEVTHMEVQAEVEKGANDEAGDALNQGDGDAVADDYVCSEGAVDVEVTHMEGIEVEVQAEVEKGANDVAGDAVANAETQNHNCGPGNDDFIDKYDWSFLDEIEVGGTSKIGSGECPSVMEKDPNHTSDVDSADDSDPDYDPHEDGEYVGEEEDFEELVVNEDGISTVEFPKFNVDVIHNPVLELGMLFESKKLFKAAVTSLAINSKRSIKFHKNDCSRVHAKCKDIDCGWECHALKVTGKSTFQIRSYKPTHSCSASFHVSNLKSTWLAERCVGDFHNDPNRNVKGWRAEVTKKFNVNISKQQAYRAKTKAISMIEGIPDDQYRKLWDYAAEIRRSNPGSTCVLDIDEDGRFSKFYLCFGAVKEGFKKGCRPFFGIDGCHLKGPRGGILLTAVGVDPANAIFPLAVAVVDIENKSTWDWFLINLKHDLGLQDHRHITIISDKQKGLIIAVTEVFPNAEHRHCVRHLHANLQQAGFRGLAFKEAMWRAARATTPGLYKLKMDELRLLNDAAFKWFENKDPSHWSKAFFSSTSKCDMLLNNVCESFNAAIMDAREKPIITMLEWIRFWMMERFQCNRDKASAAWSGKFPPKIQQTLKKLMARTSDCIPIKSNNRHYQVSCSDGSSYAVDLMLWKCSCRSWELCGIPCVHAMSAIVHSKGNVDSFVDPCYSMERYKMAYEPAILPLAGKVDWGCTMFNPPMAPIYKRPIGRPKKLRRKGTWEKEDKKSAHLKKEVTHMKRQRPSATCRNCGSSGHYQKTCKLGTTTTPSTPSQTTTTPTTQPQTTTTPSTQPQTTTNPYTQPQPTTNPSTQTQTTTTKGRKKKQPNKKHKSMLVDEDDSAFEAALAKGNEEGLIQGPSTQESFMTVGLSPWDQLHM